MSRQLFCFFIISHSILYGPCLVLEHIERKKPVGWPFFLFPKFGEGHKGSDTLWTDPSSASMSQITKVLVKNL